MRMLRLLCFVVSFSIPGFSYADSSTVFSDSLAPDLYRLSLLQQGVFQYDRILSPFQPFSLPNVEAGNFRFGLNPYSHLFSYDAEAPFLDTSKAVSDIHLILGSKREQLLMVDHHQRVARNMSGVLSYSSIVSPGFLLNSLSRFQKIKTELFYKSKQFQSSLSFRFAKVAAAENGGLLPGQSAEGLSLSDYEQLQTNLNGDDRKIREWFFYWKNEQTIVSRSSFDSLNNYSFKFFTDLRFSRFGASYRGTVDTMFYHAVFLDSLSTFDSSSVDISRCSPGLVWYYSNRNIRLSIAGGIHFYALDIKVDSIQLHPDFVSPFVRFQASTGDWQFYLNSNYVSGSWLNSGDFSVRSGLVCFPKHKWISKFELDIHQEYLLPDFCALQYSSNYFRWNNEFEKENLRGLDVEICLLNDRLSVGAGEGSWANAVYFDSTAVPRQSENSATYRYADVKTVIQRSKWKVMANLMYRHSLSDYIRLPEFGCMIRLSFCDTFFKKALPAEFGTSVYGTSSYQGYAFMPATGVRYLQYEAQSGGAPVWDVFINAGIGNRATLSLIFQKINNGLFGGENAIVANYPVPPRTVKFSLRWRLFN